MMGRTHALGGAAALAAITTASGQIDGFPLWAYGVAAVSALVPDADNEGGSLMNRKLLLPLKLATLPLHHGAAHRGRTHSLLGVAGYAGLVALWVVAANALFSLGGQPAALSAYVVLVAALAGYASHLLLDMLNIPGILLFWPIPVRVYLPPWRAMGFVPGRFNAGSRWEYWIVWLPLALFMGWFLVEHFPDTVAATLGDPTLRSLAAGMIGLLRELVGLLIELAGLR